MELRNQYRLHRLLASLETNQWSAAIAACLNSPQSYNKTLALMELWPQWGRTDPPSALAYADSIQDFQDRKSAIAGIARGWAGADPAAASAWARQLPRNRLKDSAIGAVASALAETDPNSALDLIKTVSAWWEHDGMVFSVFDTWSERAPVDAANAILQLPDNMTTAKTLERVVYVWAKTDLAAARTWAESLHEGNLRSTARSTVISYWAGQDGQAAAGYIEQLPDGQEKNELAYNAVLQWVEHDPQPAASWAMQYPDDTTACNMTSNLMHTWAESDPDGAARWIEGLPAGDIRDGVINAFAQRTALLDPGRAIRLANTVGDEESRRQATQQVARQWLKVDAVAAKTWVAQSALPDDFKKDFAGSKSYSEQP